MLCLSLQLSKARDNQKTAGIPILNCFILYHWSCIINVIIVYNEVTSSMSLMLFGVLIHHFHLPLAVQNSGRGPSLQWWDPQRRPLGYPTCARWWCLFSRLRPAQPHHWHQVLFLQLSSFLFSTLKLVTFCLKLNGFSLGITWIMKWLCKKIEQ